VIVGNLLALQDGVVVIPEGDGEERWSVNCPVVHLSAYVQTTTKT
jgi:hypothetical protein